MTDLTSPIISGIAYGLIVAIVVGPVFFTLLHTSLDRGFKVGFIFASGIVMSDSSLFLLAFFGHSQLGSYTHIVDKYLGLFGGFFLMIFGLRLILKKKKLLEEDKVDVKKINVARGMFKGFIINTMNPGTLLYWIGVVSAVSGQYEGDNRKIFAFFITIMAMIFGTDTLKAFLAGRLKHIITPTFIMYLNRGAGTVIGITGSKILYDSVWKFVG